MVTFLVISPIIFGMMFIVDVLNGHRDPYVARHTSVQLVLGFSSLVAGLIAAHALVNHNDIYSSLTGKFVMGALMSTTVLSLGILLGYQLDAKRQERGKTSAGVAHVESGANI
ncbi:MULTISPECIES: hypothetical protein [Rhodococcus]|uniref:hypothetical protein n=1 Tax=Rhodococcus TaxID=1827 RepID=UPI000641F261|nr:MULTISPECIES: hypothetical protein [Rhodococcus]AZI65564.1 hypothetical protein EHW12_31075 [Rhodococcus sp. NJ-530]KLN72951.1 hypothetical protein ABM90_03705 [Rhodococcus erythropolis]